ncbi:MAG: hypothetical protein QF903_04985 [Planctomycetota bacterium]|jgi:hypothetical protein|nr:hypothetical protein [Planctomycetota bacterium]MDP6762310.1 hypothetical protein [Planctomycetota bacterium]MDP6988812.1 hypothetical protein [Planctomycetota bacterium]
MDLDFLSRDLARYLLLALTAPLWVPFVKAVWEELNRALRDDGGVFGPLPGPAESERIEERERAKEPSLVAERLTEPGAPSAAPPRSTAVAPGTVPVEAVRRHGFR